jgi:hypothetical protein
VSETDQHPPVATSEQIELRDKKVAFYAACVAGWLSSRLELDRSLLTLSSGGIGLLLTVLKPDDDTYAGKVVYVLALVAFALCDLLVLYIFIRNGRHLEAVVQRSAPHDAVLDIIDSAVAITFLSGIALSALIALEFHRIKGV